MIKYYLISIISAIIIGACTANKKSRIAVGILMIVVGFSFIGYGALGIRTNLTLESSGKITTCKPVNCGKEGSCFFQYMVDGKKYPTTFELDPNYYKAYKVLYLPTNPAVNRSPDSLTNVPYIIPMIVGFLFACAGVAALLVRMEAGAGS